MRTRTIYKIPLLLLACVATWTTSGYLFAQESPEKTLSVDEIEAAEETLERLRSLGYINHPKESKADRERGESGLVFSRPHLVSPGYTLITALPEARALLVNARGVTVNEWHDPEARNWPRAELQPNGDLMVIGHKRSKKLLRGNYLARYDWNGVLLWSRKTVVHHDLDVRANGEILALGMGPRTDGDLYFEDQTVVLFTPEGELLREISLFDVLTSRPDIYELPRTTDFKLNKPLKDGRVDLLHANAVAQMPFPELAERGEVYCSSCVLVTVRHQSLILIFDLNTEKLLWTWGPGQVQYPHEAMWLENGNLLVFDNGSEERGYSRIVEVDPATGEIVWQHMSNRPKSFFTAGRGTSQALPGGNVLIASSNQGKIFEVTRSNKVVWRYLLRNEDGKLLTMRAAKYPPEIVEPLLAPGSIGE